LRLEYSSTPESIAMSAPSATWLSCGVSPGMFSHELGVQGQQFDGTEYALFAPRAVQTVTAQVVAVPRKSGH
jgi:hypothetical protein